MFRREVRGSSYLVESRPVPRLAGDPYTLARLEEAAGAIVDRQKFWAFLESEFGPERTWQIRRNFDLIKEGKGNAERK